MGWGSAVRAAPPAPARPASTRAVSSRPQPPAEDVDFSRLVSLDFETFYDDEITLRKLSTSEYIRHPRFEALMLSAKVGDKPTELIPKPQIKKFLKSIPWKTHSLLCHNTHFDGLILSHHYGVVPARYYCTLSMARALHSNDIGAGLDEVAVFYGGQGKIKGALESMKGLTYEDLVGTELFEQGGLYCIRDTDEMLRIFKLMLPKMPADEMSLIHMTCRMFCDPVLKVDVPRVAKEHAREVARRQELLSTLVNEADLDPGLVKKLLKTKDERLLTGQERQLLLAKRAVGSNEVFADMLRAEQIDPPTKVSPTWMKKPWNERDDADKYTYAFAKDDAEFVGLPENVDALCGGLDLATVQGVEQLKARQDRVRALVEARLAVKSTITVTRAQRFMEAGKDGMSLPVGYAYYRAHTGRWGGANSMNMQNLTRGGELRLSILADKGHRLVVVDSGQIEARVNAWLWGQDDLLAAFRAADKWDKKTMGVARGANRDAYCQFGDKIYGREITTENALERHVGKTCILGLGYMMGPAKLQISLARGKPPVFLPLEECQRIVSVYRNANHMIRNGWAHCQNIISDMAQGRPGHWKCIWWDKETIWLPNGMALRYPQLQCVEDENGRDQFVYMNKGKPTKIYGGSLCENLVQALARIIVATQMLWIDRKYRVVMTTHDEAVAHVKDKQADEALAYMLKMMKIPLDWCLDIPLNAEGGHDVNYSK